MSVYYDVGTKELETDPGRLAEGFGENLKRVQASLSATAGNQPDLDLLGVLGVLAHTPSPATLFVHSSGLQTTGLLDLRSTGSEVDVGATLAGLPQDQLPDLTGKRVVFVGLGQVAGPQRPPTERMRSAVRELWLAVCRKAHGDCAPAPLQAGGEAPRSKVAVPTIPVPVLPAVTKSGDPKIGQVTTIPLPSGIFFRPDTAEFLPGAEQKLRDMASYFRAGGGMVPVSATSVGHTATLGDAGRARTLSGQRALHVVDVLVAAGVRRSLFDHHIDGVGFDQPLARDRDAEGNFLPEAAELNRVVVLTVTRTGSTG
jgi:outer membrane protein OmpA-like peptidoglycan-associated protein